MQRLVYLATDHAGFELKNAIKEYLKQDSAYEVIDCGAVVYDAVDDYPVFIREAAQAVSANPDARAIIFGGSGQGEAMVANKYRGVRATVYYGGPTEIITLSREHNDANILSVGARFVTAETLQPLVTNWLQTAFTDEERHVRRIAIFNDIGA